MIYRFVDILLPIQNPVDILCDLDYTEYRNEGATGKRSALYMVFEVIADLWKGAAITSSYWPEGTGQ